MVEPLVELEENGVRVLVLTADGKKCQRCYRVLPEVVHDLCVRCIIVGMEEYNGRWVGDNDYWWYQQVVLRARRKDPRAFTWFNGHEHRDNVEECEQCTR